MIDDAAREIAGLFITTEADPRECSDWIRSILRKHFQPAPGIELPDAPGVWFRDGEVWFVHKQFGMGMVAAWLSPDGPRNYVRLAVLPPGNWRRAVPQKGGE